MNSPYQTMVRTSQAHGVPVRRSVDLLRRYVSLERSCMRALAGWFLRVPEYELKIMMGHQLWAHTERASDLLDRLQEMRGGHHDANVDPALAAVGEELWHASDAVSFLADWRWLLRQLGCAYVEHLAVADPSANAPEIRVLQRLAADAQRSLDRVAQVLPPATEHAHHSRLAAALHAAGGVSGIEPCDEAAHEPVPGSAARFDWPTPMVFDERIMHSDFDDYTARMELPFEQRRAAELEIYFNEFYAAGLLATILVDAWHAQAPWAFYRDMAHHFWDEVRHAEFGMVRLRELGLEPRRVNLVLFNGTRQLPFLHRLCYLTLGLEVYFMPRKQPRVKRYGEAGDARTQLFADVDWSDEGNHVQYGKRWVEHFLREDTRDVADLQAEIAEHLKAQGLVQPDGQLAPY